MPVLLKANCARKCLLLLISNIESLYCVHVGRSARVKARLGARPAKPMEMKLDVKIPWDASVVYGYSMGNTSFANSHSNVQDY